MRMILLFVCLFGSLVFSANTPLPRLQKGDTVAVIAPASTIVRYNREKLDKGISELKKHGLKVKFMPDMMMRQYGNLAGTDRQRAEEFTQMFTDPQVKAIIAATGGYGTMRFLDLVDWNVIKQNPKLFVGFSDNTALHCALNRYCDFPSVHGTGVLFLWGNAKNRPYAFRHILALSGLEEYNDSTSLNDWGGNVSDAVSYKPVTVLRQGKASGELIGGNLSMICALMGTPYEPDWKGKVLFLEDVHEGPYRIDRMLCQLKLAGVFNKVNGIILGRFRGCEPDEGEISLTISEVFNDHLGDLKVPVLVDFPIGHVEDNLPLPVGAKVRVSTKAPYLKILENPYKK